MDCKICKIECIGETPCKNCKEPMDKAVILRKIVEFIAAAIIFYWIGVVV